MQIEKINLKNESKYFSNNKYRYQKTYISLHVFVHFYGTKKTKEQHIVCMQNVHHAFYVACMVGQYFISGNGSYKDVFVWWFGVVYKSGWC